MRRLISQRVLVFLVLPVIIQAGVLVPEFAVTEGLGEFYSYKTELCADCNPAGELVIAWTDTRLGGNFFAGFRADEFHQVYSQYVNSQGVPQGVNNRMNTGENFVLFPKRFDMAIFDDGKVLSAVPLFDKGSQYSELAVMRLWESGRNMSDNPELEYEIGLKDPIYLACDDEDLYVAVQGISDELFFQLYTREGELVVDSGTIDSAYAQDVIMDNAGNFVIFYEDENNDYNYQRFNSSGEIVGERVCIPDRSVIAGEAGSTLLCCWKEGGDIYCCIYSNDDVQDALHLVSNNQDISNIEVQSGPGGFLVTWSTEDTLYGRLVNSTGIPYGEVMVINEPEGVFVGTSSIASDEERFRIAWVESEWISNPQGWLYTRMVYPSGLMSSSVERVCDDESGVHSGWNEAVLMPDGGFCNLRQGGISRYVDDGVSLMYLDNSGVIRNHGFELGDVTASRLTLGCDGNLYLSYVKTEDDIDRLWVQRLSQAGDPIGSPFELYSFDEGRDISATVTAVGDDGEGVVVWVKGSLYVQLWAQRFTKSGLRVGEPILVSDTFQNRGGLNAFKFDDGSFIIGHCFQISQIYYYYFLYNKNGTLIQRPWYVDKTFSTTQGCYTMACNGEDRFVATWVSYHLDSICFQVHDYFGNNVGEAQAIVPPDFGETTSLKWGGYYPSVSMAPDGRFVIYWQTQDDVGNLNLWAQCFSRDGEALNTPFQVNDPDCWEGCQQISGWRGVSAQNDRILFTWLDNRYHRGWDIMAKVTDWNVGGPAVEDDSPRISSLSLTTSLNQLSYDVPEEATLTLYSAAGRLVHREEVTGQGEIEFSSLPQGVYFAQLKSVASSNTEKILILR